jgi:hypothetical protein
VTWCHGGVAKDGVGGELTSGCLEAWDCWYPVANHADARGVRTGESWWLEVDCRRVMVMRRMASRGGCGGRDGGDSSRHCERLPLDSRLNRVLVRGLNN